MASLVPTKSRIWFPEHTQTAESGVFLDSSHDDFDEQAERFVGHDQEYIQVTKGSFSGRFFSADLHSKFSVFIEYANQGLSQHLAVPAGTLSVLMLLEEGCGVLHINGRQVTRDDMVIATAGCPIDVVSPVDGCVMAVCFDKALFLESCFDDEVRDCISNLSGIPHFVNCARLANSLKEDALAALESLRMLKEEQDQFKRAEALAIAVHRRFSAQLALLTDIRQSILGLAACRRYSSVQAAVATMRAAVLNPERPVSNLPLVGVSERTLQSNFSDFLGVPPTHYQRLIRLHEVRKILKETTDPDLAIGDIASRFGFWNSGRFSHYYHRQFGELPSETKMRDYHS